MTSTSGIIGKISATWSSHSKLAKEQASDAIIRGFKWAGILVAITTVPLAVTSLFFSDINDVHLSLGHTSQIGLALAALAGGAKIHWLEVAGDINLDVSGSVKLTLLTVLLQVAALRHGRKLGRTSLGTLYIPVLLTAFGFATTIFLATYLTHGFDGIITSPKASDYVRLILCVAVPMTVGAIFRNYSENGVITEFRTSLKSVRIYAVLLTATSVLGLATFWLVELIRPDFLHSQLPQSEPTREHFALYVTVGILALALNLPTIIIGSLSVLTGASIAASVYSSTQIPSFLSGSINNICDFGGLSCEATNYSISNHFGLLTFVNDYSLAKRATFIAIFLFTIGLLMALSSSFAAAGNVPEETMRKRVFRNLIAYSLVGGYFIWLVNGEFTMTEQPTSKFETNLSHGSGSIGLAAGTIFAIAAIFAFLAGLATGEKAKSGLPVAFPRIARVFRVEPSAQGENQGGWRAFGLITSAVLSLTIILSLAGATYELVYAKSHGPKFFASKVQKALETGDVAGFKKLTGNPKDFPWLNKQIMTRALPSATAAADIEIENDLGKKYVTGQLDSVLTYALGGSDSEVKYSLPLTGKTLSIFHIKFGPNLDADYLTKAKFTYDARPVHLAIHAGKFIPKTISKQLKINNTKAKIGTFNTVPGKYNFVLPGYKLIAPTNITVETSSNQESVTVGAEAKIPEKLNSLISRKYDSVAKGTCKIKPTKTSFGSNCADDYEIWNSKELISGKELTSFDSYTLSKVHKSKLSCNDEGNVLISASSVERTYKCSTTVTFTLKSTKDAVYEQGDPIYRDVPQYSSEQYDSCPTAPYYCWETRQVYTGTIQEFVGYKRGDLITPAKSVTGKFKATVSTDIVIKGTQQNSGKFTVSVE